MPTPFARIPGRYDDTARRQEIDNAIGRRRRSTRVANLGVFTGYRIGLDLGNGNIGWGILFERERTPFFMTAETLAAHNASLPPGATRTQLPDPHLFVPLGTHKFEARNSDGKALSKVRAEARAKRRTLDARQRRRWTLKQVLQRHGLYPTAAEATRGLTIPGRQGPVPVKADVLRVRLLQPGTASHPHDLGRALYNVLKRRGWMQVLGRTGAQETSAFGRKATAAYKAALDKFGCRTVGEFLNRCQHDALIADHRRIRKRHKTLAWQETHKVKQRKPEDLQHSFQVMETLSPTFELMWEEACALRVAQKDAVPISDEAWQEIREAADFRRPLRPKEPGLCEFLPQKRRCVRALPSFQQFRILQQVDNLRQDGRELPEHVFEQIVDHLCTRDRSTVQAVGRELGLRRLGLAEKDQSRALAGAKTDVGLAEVLGPGWMEIEDIEQRDRWTMRFLRRHPMPVVDSPPRAWSPDDEERLKRDAERAFGPGALERVDERASQLFDDKFANISTLAARLLSKGIRQRLPHEERLAILQREGGMESPHIDLYERLPYYARVMPDLAVPAANFAPLERTAEEERECGRAANPDLHVVLNRVRKVVNAIIDMMGGILPTQVIVEVAREALSEEAAEKHGKVVRDRTALREAVVADIARVLDGQRMPVGPSLDRIVDRWLAAIRQGWRDYDGSEIAKSHLVDGTIYQLDHVVPAAFGQFQKDNLFVSKTALNRRKGRRLPWEAFPELRPELMTFALFGKRRQLEGLKAAETRLRRGSVSRRELDRIGARITSLQQELEALCAANPAADDPRILGSLERTRSTRLESLLDPAGTPDDARGSGRGPVRPGEQAALFARLGPDAAVPEEQHQARDVANIGWSTKVTTRYLGCLGPRTLTVKPWAVHALRCMFDINKERKDLRNHAVDAFLIAHFDEHVMRPAFARLRGTRYEDLYTAKPLEDALGEVSDGPAVFDAFRENLRRLDDILPTIATAHRPDNKWNPGDRPGGSFGALGGENIYAFRPDKDALARLSKIVNNARGIENGPTYTKAQLRALLEAAVDQINDPAERQACLALRKATTLSYRGRKKPVSFEIFVKNKSNPGSFLNISGKFGVTSRKNVSELEIISIHDFSKSDISKRNSYFSPELIFYRNSDCIVYNGFLCTISAFSENNQITIFPVDDIQVKSNRIQPTVKKFPSKLLEKFPSDVLGRRLHRRRKNPGDLQPVPYPLLRREDRG